MADLLQPAQSFPAPGKHLCGLAWDGSRLWHSDGGDNRIYCFEVPGGTLLRALPCPDVRTCLAWDGSHLWQVAGRPKRLRCIDPSDGSVVRELALDSEHACGVEIEGDRLWLTKETQGRLELRSLADGALLQQFEAEPRIAGVTVARGVVWYTADEQALLVAVDAATGLERARFRLPGTPTGLTWDGGQLWYADFAARRIAAVPLPD